MARASRRFSIGVLAFAVGFAVGSSMVPPDVAFSAAVAAVAWVGAITARGHSRTALTGIACLAVGAGAAAAALGSGQPERLAPFMGTIEGRVERIVLTRDGAIVTLAPVWAPITGERLPRSRLRVASDSPLRSATVGDTARAQVRLQPVRGPANPGARDRRNDWPRVGASGGLVHPNAAVIVEQAAAMPSGLQALRLRTARRLQSEGRGGALLAALALGERSGLGPDVADWAARAGLSHLLAVSGLHLGLVGALAFTLTRWGLRRGAALARWDRRRLALLAAVVMGVAYAALSGWPVSMQRALMFVVIAGSGVAIRRVVSRLHLVALAAAGVLIVEPIALFSAGAQLSFVATAALLVDAASSPKASHAVVALARASLVASCATAPIAAWHFGTASPMGWVANLLAIPWTAGILLPAALVAAACAALDQWDGVIAVAAWLGDRSLDAGAALASAFPVRAGGRPGALACGTAFVLALGVVWLRRWPTRALAATASAAVLGLAPVPGVQPTGDRVVFLDVGWGDATVVEVGGKTILVDAGVAGQGGRDAGATVVVPALRALGIRRIDLLIVTHADRDHAGGVPAVLKQFEVGVIWLPLGGARDPGFGAIRNAARGTDTPVVETGQGRAPFRIRGLAAFPLWPPPGPRLKGNAGSLVVRIEAGGRRVLLTGDLGKPGEWALRDGGADLSADVLKLGHHGSKTSSDAGFLASVAPAWAIVSAPRRGRLAFPHPTVLERLDRAEIDWAWTGRDGAVLIELETLRARTWRGGWRVSPNDPARPVVASP